ncbi:MAG TPA: MBL fold metallo-hydrolase [Terriglobia bacterium]|nr:MBL fold metallo-hydrolase [Terriglobia bacterium]
MPIHLVEQQMQLYPGVYQIQSLYGGRNLFQYLFVGDNVVLVDTGIATTPEKTIFPFFDSLKLRPQQLTLAVTTHADLDHQGGNGAIKRISPGTVLSCGEADRRLIENPAMLYGDRYNFLKEDHEVGFEPDPSPDAGRRQSMDVSFSGGERIHLGENWWLEVLHVPGHSHGHLALYDRTFGALFAGDAVQGRGCPKATGGMAIPVTYYHVDTYLSTIRYFEHLPISVLYTGHWPVMRGEEVKDFLAESRRTVEFVDRVILRSLETNRSGLTLKELIDTVAAAVGDWPDDGVFLAMFPIKGHMDRLEQQGKVNLDRGSHPAKWVKA